MYAVYPFIAVAEAQCYADVACWQRVVEQRRIGASRRLERMVPSSGRGVTGQSA